MACTDACAHSVLTPELDKDGYYRVRVSDIEACTGCGLCTKICPVFNKPQNKPEPPRCYAVWAKDEHLREACASGGAFGAMAAHILSLGGIVYGAAIDGFRIKHRRVDSIEALPPLLGSKYQHSETSGIFRQVRKDLISGKTVLFSGLSCQVAGLKSYLGRIGNDNLVTVDTICGGLSTMLPMLALERSGKYTGIRSFRDKSNGWRPAGFRYALKMDRPDGTVEDLGLDNPVLNTFSSKLLKRENCLQCQFNGTDRISDITIGDFWGDTAFPEQHAKGLSVAIARSWAGDNLVKDSLAYSPVDIDSINPGNPNLKNGHYPLVKLLPTRKAALKFQREEEFDKAWQYMSSHTLPGILLRLAVKAGAMK